jgi:hypothetical protein
MAANKAIAATIKLNFFIDQPSLDNEKYFLSCSPISRLYNKTARFSTATKDESNPEEENPEQES